MVNLEHVQQDGPGKCGLACLEMIFKYYKIPYKKSEMWNSIKEPRGDDQGEFARLRSLAKYAIEKGLNATGYRDKADTCLNILDRLEQLNMPAILSVRYEETHLGHLIAYRGKENGYYFFNDPDLKAPKSPVKYSADGIKERWAPCGREVAGFEYAIFDGVTIPHTCMFCTREYPILAPNKAPFSNKVPFSNKTICPYCNTINFDIWNLE